MATKAFVLKFDDCTFDYISGPFVAVDNNNNPVGIQPRNFAIWPGPRYSDTGIGLRAKIIAAVRNELGDQTATVVFVGDLLSL